MSESHEKKIKPVPVLVTLLVLVVVFQTGVLIHQGRKQAALEAEQQKIAAFSHNQKPTHLARGAFPQAGGVSRGFPRSFMDDDPWETFDAMSRRMNSLIQHAFVFGSPLFQTSALDSGFDLTPAVDLEETQDAYIVTSDLPGLEKDKIDLTVKENILTIEGRRETTQETKDPNQSYYAQERSYGSFARSLSLPGPVDEAKITATYTNGVLTITLPKAAEGKSAQKVTIQ